MREKMGNITTDIEQPQEEAQTKEWKKSALKMIVTTILSNNMKLKINLFFPILGWTISIRKNGKSLPTLEVHKRNHWTQKWNKWQKIK